MLKRLEALIKHLLYVLFRVVLRNKPVALPLDARKVHKILIFRYDRLGDMVVTTPVFNLLCERLPHAEIHVLASPRNEALLRHDSRIANVYLWDGTLGSLAALRPLIRVAFQTRREHYDLILPFVFGSQTTMAGIMANLIGGSRAVKPTLFHEERQEQYAALFNVHLPISFSTLSMAEIIVRYTCLMFGWEFAPALISYGIALSEEHKHRAEEFCKAYTITPASTVLFNLSAGKHFCQWSEERNRAFLEMFSEQYPHLRVLLSAAPPEYGQQQRFADMFPNVVTMPATNDILDVVAFMRHVGFVVTPDTSMVHFATAFRVPLVVFYSQMSFGYDWLPYGDFPFRTVFTNGAVPSETIAPERVMTEFTDLYANGLNY